MSKKNTDHLKMSNRDDGRYEMICEHCDTYTIITPPLTMDEFLSRCKRFEVQHRDCKKEGPAA